MPNPLQMGGPPSLPEQVGSANPNGLQVRTAPVLLGGDAPQPSATPQAPTHEQTVAALRHFDAIKGGLVELLKDPAVGRSDVKDKIIDGMAKLVSERMVSAPNAVMQLSQVPSDPVAQRKWLQTMLQNTIQAEFGIIEHHRNGNLGSGDWATEAKQHVVNHDDHLYHMTALAKNYGGKKNG